MCRHIILAAVHERRDPGVLLTQLVGDQTPLLMAFVTAVLGENRVQERRHDRALALPTWAMALRMKCTRQRRQVGLKTLKTAALRPSWASDITSFTPRRLRRIRLHRKSVEIGSASDGPTRMPRTSRPPSVFTASAIITATETMRPASRILT